MKKIPIRLFKYPNSTRREAAFRQVVCKASETWTQANIELRVDGDVVLLDTDDEVEEAIACLRRVINGGVCVSGGFVFNKQEAQDRVITALDAILAQPASGRWIVACAVDLPGSWNGQHIAENKVLLTDSTSLCVPGEITPTQRDDRRVFAHELGHALGLRHVDKILPDNADLLMVQGWTGTILTPPERATAQKNALKYSL